jgi:hypothetical protein
METQWFPTSKEVQDAEVIKQGVGICLLGQDGILLVDFLEKGATITAKNYVAFLNEMKLQLASKKDSHSFKTMLLLTRRPLYTNTRNSQIFTSKL